MGIDLRAMSAPASGIGRFTISLVRALQRRGAFRYLGMAHRNFESVGAELGNLPFEVQSAPLGAIWQQLRLPSRLGRGDIDLFWSPLFTLPLRSRLPAVVTVHDLTALLLPEAHRWKVRWSQRPFLGPSLARARRVLADSESTANDLRQHFPDCAARLEVVYPGVDPEFRPAAPAEVAQIRTTLGCHDGYLLYAGVLEPRKNVATLLDAWEELRRSDPGTPPLVLAGPVGWHSAALEARIRELDPLGLQALGFLERARFVEVVQGALVFAYPSLYEGFGLPVAEAMACGVPVVTSNRSSLPEIVGDAGVLVDPERPSELAAALRTLLDDADRRRQLSETGRERVAHFTWERAAEQMEDVFRRALQ